MFFLFFLLQSSIRAHLPLSTRITFCMTSAILCRWASLRGIDVDGHHCLTLTHSPQVQTTILKSTAKGEFLVTCILTIGTGVYCGQYNTGFCRGSLPPCCAHPTVISCSKWVALKLPGTFCPQLGKVQVSQLPYEGFQLHYSWQENILLWLLQDGLNILLPLTKAGRQLQRIGQISSQGVLKPGLSGN